MTDAATPTRTGTTPDRTTRIVHGTCHHDCPDSCGWQVTVDGAQAVQMRGNPAHPYSKGELCPKVNRFLDRVYSPERVLHPLRRVGAKGESHFEQITWADALDEIATRFHAIIAEHGAEAIMPYVSAGNQSLLAIMFGNRFWHRLGASRVLGALCGAAAGAGAASTNGTGKGIDPSDVIHSKLIILWGTNTRLTNRHLWPTIEAARAGGAQVIVIDPLRTVTADGADWFLQPLPGTDVALMLAMMHVLVRDGLVDREWVDAHTIGFDDLAAHVAGWTPARAAAITGLAAADIERLATLYGTVRPAAIRTLIGAEHHEHGAMFFRTLTCLPALVGAWRDQGGGYARSVGVWSNDVMDHAALTRPDLLAGRSPRGVQMVHLGRLLTGDTDALLGGPPIKAVMMIGVNAMVSVPSTELVRQGLARDDLFTVVHDLFQTDTADYADILLPATSHMEQLDIHKSYGHLYLQVNHPAIPPLGEALPNTELFRRLAREMGFSEACFADSDEDLCRQAFDWQDPRLAGLSWEKLSADGHARLNLPTRHAPFAQGGFPTPSGKCEFYSAMLASQGFDPLPAFTAPREWRHSPLAQEFPLALITPPARNFLNTSFANSARFLAQEKSPALQINPADAAARGIVEGSPLRIFNRRGEFSARAVVTDRVRPGVAMASSIWWRKLSPDGRNCNEVTSQALTDMAGGATFYDCLVEVAAAR